MAGLERHIQTLYANAACLENRFDHFETTMVTWITTGKPRGDAWAAPSLNGHKAQNHEHVSVGQ